MNLSKYFLFKLQTGEQMYSISWSWLINSWNFCINSWLVSIVWLRNVEYSKLEAKLLFTSASNESIELIGEFISSGIITSKSSS